MIWKDVEGWFSEQDAMFVSSICNQIKNGIVVEIGIFAGRSTAVMAPICINNNNKYYAIDNFIGGSDQNTEASIIHRQRDMKSIFIQNMEKLNLIKNINLIIGDSSSSSVNFENDTIDFCFIDADHTPEAVQKDIDSWWPKIKNNGIIGGHDYPSPLRNIVDNFVKNQNLKSYTGGRCWAIVKDKNV